MEKKLNQKQTPKLNDAIVFVTEAYDGCTLKGTSVPYVLFLLESAMVAATMSDDEDILAATVLHEALVDERISEDELKQRFGERVANIVIGITSTHVAYRVTPVGAMDKHRVKVISYLDKEATDEERIVSLADHLTVLRILSSDYDKLGNRMWFRYEEADKEKHAHYFWDVYHALREYKETSAGREYKNRLRYLFKEQLKTLTARYKAEYKRNLARFNKDKEKSEKLLKKALKQAKKRHAAAKKISESASVKEHRKEHGKKADKANKTEKTDKTDKK